MAQDCPAFRILDHTADVGLEAYGTDLSALFANAARGMFQIMADPRTVQPLEQLPVEAAAEDTPEEKAETADDAAAEAPAPEADDAEADEAEEE